MHDIEVASVNDYFIIPSKFISQGGEGINFSNDKTH